MKKLLISMIMLGNFTVFAECIEIYNSNKFFCYEEYAEKLETSTFKNVYFYEPNAHKKILNIKKNKENGEIVCSWIGGLGSEMVSMTAGRDKVWRYNLESGSVTVPQGLSGMSKIKYLKDVECTNP